MRTKLTPAFISKAKPPPGKDRAVFWDLAMPGFGLMTTANGARSYVVQYRANGISRRLTLKTGLTLTEAKREAKAVLGKVAKNGDPVEEARAARNIERNTLGAVAEEHIARESKNLRARTLDDKRDILRRYIDKPLGSRPIDSIKRSEIVRLLDKVEDKNGPVAAHHTLAILRRLMNWHAARDDDFRSPIVRGMARLRPKERARSRTLTDDELRAVWKVADTFGPYGAMLQFVLLTATRLLEAAQMTRAELSADGGEWTIPAARYKSNRDHLIPLSVSAAKVLAEIPVIGDRGWMFTTSGLTPISGFSKYKRRLDGMVLEELRKHDPKATLPRWTTHDLRRTARTLLSRAGVDSDIAERCLGHTLSGVRHTYDRHEYAAEKARAFELLAGEIGRIISPPEPTIVPLRRPKKPA